MKIANKNLKIGFIGGGKMAIKHMQAIKPINFAEITAVADPNVSKETVHQAAGRNIQFYISAKEMFDNEQLDVVHIVTPKGTHFELALMALEKNANIYLEKPFTETVDDANKLVKIANEKKSKICPGHQLLFQEPSIQAQEILNLVGKPVYLESYFAFRTARKSISAMDQLLDIFPHPTYTLLHFMSLLTDQNDDIKILAKDVKLNGEAQLLIKKGSANAFLNVTLNGRPVDSYLKIVGTNGLLHIDLVRDILIKNLGPGGDALAAVFSPYNRAMQMIWKSTKSFVKLALGKNQSYPGLPELITEFYTSIVEDKSFSITPESIIDSVKIYEQIKNELTALKNEMLDELKVETLEKMEYANSEGKAKDVVLLTGGTGFLGGAVAKKLSLNGHRVKNISRNIPEENKKIKGVEYYKADIAGNIPDDIFEGVNCVVHCAAETSGGKEEHIKNSIEATLNLYKKSLDHGIEKFIHISSIAVLKPPSIVNKNINEKTAVDAENEGRGPYVWGKAQSEISLLELENNSSLKIKILRPGPLVDYANFEAPGRLGKQIGQRFIVMGSKNSKLSVCDINSTANVIQYYIDNYSEVPKILNVIDPETPTRKDLIYRLSKVQLGLKATYIPSILVSFIALSLKVVQKIMHPTKKALDIKAAFESVNYDTTLISKINQELDK